MQTQPTTPFGRRSLTLAMVASQASARDFAGKPGNSETVVHKWRLFRALTEGQDAAFANRIAASNARVEKGILAKLSRANSQISIECLKCKL